jgi:23S rRNA (cytidine1920-2'-O)/16S rRNA (cytidine1409-2'-O)-methyltransferase
LRADQALVDRGLVASRALAKRLIEAGAVFIDSTPLSKPSLIVRDEQVLLIEDSLETQFVSRAGAKLSGALTECQTTVEHRTCLDLGQSTGGFTDCLMRAGAERVIGIDVGHGQLVEQLAKHPRVVAIEGCNVRQFDPANDERTKAYVHAISLIVVDLSFISLQLILPVITRWFSKAPVELICLVKPQFEVGKGRVNKQGLVTDKALLACVEQRLKDTAIDLGWSINRYFDSPIKGGDGNAEFFLHANLNTHLTPISVVKTS